jgi:hypothetical protein
MSFGKKSQDLLDKITDQVVIEMVSGALRQAHAKDASAIKRIGVNTGIKIHTIPKWYHARNAPKSSHLMILAATYPSILSKMLELMGQTQFRHNSNDYLASKKTSELRLHYRKSYTVEGDKFVHLNVSLPKYILCALNIRQLWFLTELQKGKKINAKTITDFWKISLRTAKRDIQELGAMGLTKFEGSPNNGFYVMVLVSENDLGSDQGGSAP